MKSVCKFYVKSVEHSFEGAERIKLTAVYDPNVASEEGAFTKYTPSGELEFQLQNPNLLGSFQPGEKYYLVLVTEEEYSPGSVG